MIPLENRQFFLLSKHSGWQPVFRKQVLKKSSTGVKIREVTYIPHPEYRPISQRSWGPYKDWVLLAHGDGFFCPVLNFDKFLLDSIFPEVELQCEDNFFISPLKATTNLVECEQPSFQTLCTAIERMSQSGHDNSGIFALLRNQLEHDRPPAPQTQPYKYQPFRIGDMMPFPVNVDMQLRNFNIFLGPNTEIENLPNPDDRSNPIWEFVWEEDLPGFSDDSRKENVLFWNINQLVTYYDSFKPLKLRLCLYKLHGEARDKQSNFRFGFFATKIRLERVSRRIERAGILLTHANAGQPNAPAFLEREDYETNFSYRLISPSSTIDTYKMASQWGNRSWLRAGSEVDVSEDVEGDVRTYWQKRGDFRIGAAMFQNEVVENEDDEDQDPEENLVPNQRPTAYLGPLAEDAEEVANFKFKSNCGLMQMWSVAYDKEGEHTWDMILKPSLNNRHKLTICRWVSVFLHPGIPLPKNSGIYFSPEGPKLGFKYGSIFLRCYLEPEVTRMSTQLVYQNFKIAHEVADWSLACLYYEATRENYKNALSYVEVEEMRYDFTNGSYPVRFSATVNYDQPVESRYLLRLVTGNLIYCRHRNQNCQPFVATVIETRVVTNEEGEDKFVIQMETNVETSMRLMQNNQQTHRHGYFICGLQGADDLVDSMFLTFCQIFAQSRHKKHFFSHKLDLFRFALGLTVDSGIFTTPKNRDTREVGMEPNDWRDVKKRFLYHLDSCMDLPISEDVKEYLWQVVISTDLGCILEGGPGAGKTTILCRFIHACFGCQDDVKKGILKFFPFSRILYIYPSLASGNEMFHIIENKILPFYRQLSRPLQLGSKKRLTNFDQPVLDVTFWGQVTNTEFEVNRSPLQLGEGVENTEATFRDWQESFLALLDDLMHLENPTEFDINHDVSHDKRLKFSFFLRQCQENWISVTNPSLLGTVIAMTIATRVKDFRAQIILMDECFFTNRLYSTVAITSLDASGLFNKFLMAGDRAQLTLLMPLIPEKLQQLTCSVAEYLTPVPHHTGHNYQAELSNVKYFFLRDVYRSHQDLVTDIQHFYSNQLNPKETPEQLREYWKTTTKEAGTCFSHVPDLVFTEFKMMIGQINNQIQHYDNRSFVINVVGGAEANRYQSFENEAETLVIKQFLDHLAINYGCQGPQTVTLLTNYSGQYARLKRLVKENYSHWTHLDVKSTGTIQGLQTDVLFASFVRSGIPEADEEVDGDMESALELSSEKMKKRVGFSADRHRLAVILSRPRIFRFLIVSRQTFEPIDPWGYIFARHEEEGTLFTVNVPEMLTEEEGI